MRASDRIRRIGVQLPKSRLYSIERRVAARMAAANAALSRKLHMRARGALFMHSIVNLALDNVLEGRNPVERLGIRPCHRRLLRLPSTVLERLGDIDGRFALNEPREQLLVRIGRAVAAHKGVIAEAAR